MAEEYTNPAEGLLNVFDALHDSWPQHPHVSGFDALRHVFGGYREPDAVESEAAFLRFVSDVFSLPSAIILAMRALEAHELEWALDDLEAINAGLSMAMLQNNLESSRSWLDDAHRRCLRASVTRLNLSDAWREERLPLDAIMALLTAVRQLQADVVEAESLPSEFRSWLVEALADVEDALLQYRLLGTRSLRRVLDAAAGRLAYDQRLREQASTDRTVWERTKSVFKTIERVVLFAAGALYVVQVTTGLPWETSPPVEEVVLLLPPSAELTTGSSGALPPARSQNDDVRSNDFGDKTARRTSAGP